MPVLLLAGWLGLVTLRVNRPWLVVLVAVPLNGLADVATQASEPRLVAVVAVSAATWAIGGVVAAPRTAS